jgi:hypothetical protein
MRSALQTAGRLALAMGLLGLLGACGSGSTPTAAGTASPVANSAAPSSAPAAATPSPAGGGDSTQFCALVKQQLDFLQGGGMAKLMANGTPDGWKSYLAQVLKMDQSLMDAAPADIQPTLITLKSNTQKLDADLAAVGYVVTKIPSSTLMSLVNTQQQADGPFVTYVHDHCGLSLPTAAG